MEKKDIYIGFVGELKSYDSGVRKYSISFKSEQLDELKKYLTARGSVNLDFVIKKDESAFISVFNPHAPVVDKSTYSTASLNDLPF
jgi:type 1 fimbria pilin